MELCLTGGVLFSLLCDIKKKPIPKSETRNGKKDPASEFEMMKALCEIAQGHKYKLNDNSLRSKITDYKNCECDGNVVIPLEKNIDDSENADYYLFDRDATKKRIALFVDTFIDVENKDAIERFVNTINEIIHAEITTNRLINGIDMIEDIISGEIGTITLEEYLYQVIYFVIYNHGYNKAGMEALKHIRNDDYSPRTSKLTVTVKKLSKELRFQYIKDLEVPNNAREGWEEYLKNLKADYENVRVYYDPDREYPFYDVYVHSALSTIDPFRRKVGNELDYNYENPTAKNISYYSKRVIVSGTGGLGKTMLMRHLLLDAIDNDSSYVPVFVSVKKYTDKYKSFADYIYSQCCKFDSLLTKEKLLKLYASDRCLLIIDGFDELQSQYKQDFSTKFDDFLRVDFNNIIIMSSRPVETHIPRHFSTLYICPLYDDQPNQLVDKLAKLHHDTSVGERFKHELTAELKYTHESYIENPLLLTLMFRIFEEYSSIPQDKFTFYHKAYEVLSHQHDARKEDGGFLRSYNTGLSPNEFAEVFKKFCAYSLILEGKTSFNGIDMQEYFYLVMSKTKKDYCFTLEDFIHDATVSTGLMYHDFDRYEFIHRSMQEFFCAWYISQQEDSHLYELLMKLQSYGKGLVMETFLMLDEMIPLKLEKYVYLPYLNDLLSEDREHLHDCYKDYLCRIYNDISYCKVNGTLSFTRIEPSEAIYSLCMKDKLVTDPGSYYLLPEDSEFEEEDILECVDVYGNSVVVQESELPKYDGITKPGENKIIGHIYSFKLSYVLSDPDTYQEYTDVIFSYQFPLYKEYYNAIEYLYSLKQKYRDDINSTDIEDLLT